MKQKFSKIMKIAKHNPEFDKMYFFYKKKKREMYIDMCVENFSSSSWASFKFCIYYLCVTTVLELEGRGQIIVRIYRWLINS